MSGNFILTIGREYGSGGREIGENIARQLGIRCIDKELLKATAENSGLSENILKQYDEVGSKSLLYSLVTGLTPSSNSVPPLPVQVYLEQFKTIQYLADRESCVFIGRCSDYALRDHENLVRVFIHAPLPDRIRRICRRNGLDERTARARIAKLDRSRATYYNQFTSQKWGSTKNYDLTLDTGKVGIDGAVSVILRYIELFRENRKQAQPI